MLCLVSAHARDSEQATYSACIDRARRGQPDSVSTARGLTTHSESVCEQGACLGRQLRRCSDRGTRGSRQSLPAGPVPCGVQPCCRCRTPCALRVVTLSLWCHNQVGVAMQPLTQQQRGKATGQRRVMPGESPPPEAPHTAPARSLPAPLRTQPLTSVPHRGAGTGLKGTCLAVLLEACFSEQQQHCGEENGAPARLYCSQRAYLRMQPLPSHFSRDTLEHRTRPWVCALCTLATSSAPAATGQGVWQTVSICKTVASSHSTHLASHEQLRWGSAQQRGRFQAKCEPAYARGKHSQRWLGLQKPSSSPHRPDHHDRLLSKRPA